MVALSRMKIPLKPMELAKNCAFSEQKGWEYGHVAFLITLFSLPILITMRGKGVGGTKAW